jgi:hypothetical protein
MFRHRVGQPRHWLLLLASPYVLDLPHEAGMRVAIFVGAAVTFLALLELWLIHNWIEQGWDDPHHEAGG